MPRFSLDPSNQIDNDLDRTGLDAVLRTAPDAVIIMRPNGTIAGWNDTAERIFGWTYGEVRGLEMANLIIPPRFRVAHRAGLRHYLRTGEGPVMDKKIQLTALRKNGEEFPIEITITRTSQFSEPVFMGFIRDITADQKALAHQDLLIGELNHRVKNLLSVVSGIAYQTARTSKDLDGFRDSFMGRIQSLAHGHEIITNADWQSAPLKNLIQAQLGSYASGEEARINIRGTDVKLPPKKILSLSMIFHELLTNAVKYGALMDEHGKIDIRWKIEEGQLEITWREKCLRDITAPLKKGFGSKMIDMAMRHELHGEGGKTWHANGLEFNIRFNIGATNESK